MSVEGNPIVKAIEVRKVQSMKYPPLYGEMHDCPDEIYSHGEVAHLPGNHVEIDAGKNPPRELLQQACAEAKVPLTKRQARKYRFGRGAAYTHRHQAKRALDRQRIEAEDAARQAALEAVAKEAPEA